MTFRDFAYAGLIISTLVTITACGSVPTNVRVESSSQPTQLEQADSLAKEGKFGVAATKYWEMAMASTSPEKENFQLRAAELALQADDVTTSTQFLKNVNEQVLNNSSLARKRILSARIAAREEHYATVLRLLPRKLLAGSPEYAADILQLRAQALAASNRPLAATNTYDALLSIQTNPTARSFTEQAIWRLLANVSSQELQGWETDSSDTVLHGWIDLATIKRTRYLSAGQLNQDLENWRKRYPEHPASSDLLVSIVEEWESYFVMPQKIAVLLPMSGQYAKLAQVIYAGILTAREAATENSFTPQITLYDTQGRPDKAISLYQQAIQEGAEFVIGPLNKEAVNLFAELTELPIPVLTLNYAEDSVISPGNLFQFGLLPEDEARQVAERASLDNRNSAVILAPDNEWGSRFVSAFTQRYDELGAHVAQVERYQPENTDYSQTIKSLLKLDESEARYKQLRNLLNLPLEFEPQRREDIDMLFLISTPRNARLLRPQINYYYATDLPVYSTSHIFSGVENTSVDRDINGVIFCDIPWIIQPTPEQQLLEEFLELQAGNDYKLLPRFAALGIDALQVIPDLRQLAALPHERFNGVTGTLRISQNNRIYRELKWATFVDGRPVSLNYDNMEVIQ